MATVSMNRTYGKIAGFWVIKSKIYLPCNFEVNLITHLGVIALFSSNFLNFNTFHLIFQKLLEIKVKFILQICAACQDLHILQLLSKNHYPFWSYFPFFINCFFNVILFVLYFKNYKR